VAATADLRKIGQLDAQMVELMASTECCIAVLEQSTNNCPLLSTGEKRETDDSTLDGSATRYLTLKS
jgi:hypothetical protein